MSNGVDVLQIKYSTCLAMKNDFIAVVKKVLDNVAFDILCRAHPIDLICAISAAAQLATFEMRNLCCSLELVELYLNIFPEKSFITFSNDK